MLVVKGSLRLPLRLTCCEGETLRMSSLIRLMLGLLLLLGVLLLLLMLLCDVILRGFSAWVTLATLGCVNEGFCGWIVWRGRWWGYDGVSEDVVKMIC